MENRVVAFGAAATLNRTSVRGRVHNTLSADKMDSDRWERADNPNKAPN